MDMGSDRSVAVSLEDGVDAGLITRTLGLEPFQYVLINPQGNGSLGGLHFQTFADHASHNVLDISLGMIRSWFGHAFFKLG